MPIPSNIVIDELNIAAIEAWNQTFAENLELDPHNETSQSIISNWIKEENKRAKNADAQYLANPNYAEYFNLLKAKREEIIAKDGYIESITNTGSNYVCVTSDKSVYLVKRGENGNPVGNIGGLCERTPASISSNLTAWLSQAGESYDVVGKLLTAFNDNANEAWRKDVNEFLKVASELGDSNNIKEYIRSRPELIDAIDFLENHKTDLFKSLKGSLYSKEGLELLSGGKDDIITQDGNPYYITDQKIILENNFARESYEEVGRLGGLNLKEIINDGRSIKVNTSGVTDYGWVLGNKGKALGNPFLTNGDYLVLPAVTMMMLNEKETNQIAEAAKDHVSNAEVNEIVKHSLQDALVKSMTQNNKGGYQYPHEAYPILVLSFIKEYQKGGIDLSDISFRNTLEEIGENIENFSLENFVKPSGITVDQLCKNLISTAQEVMETMELVKKNNLDNSQFVPSTVTGERKSDESKASQLLENTRNVQTI